MPKFVGRQCCRGDREEQGDEDAMQHPVSLPGNGSMAK
jgi:hypothetical protein